MAAATRPGSTAAAASPIQNDRPNRVVRRAEVYAPIP